jgi:hypothetical protein
MRVSFVLRSAEASSLGLCNCLMINYRDITLLPSLLTFLTPETIGTSNRDSAIRANHPQLSGHPSGTCKKPSTPWCSRAVPQPSTDPALHRLAAEFGWDPACSMQYGRRLTKTRHLVNNQKLSPNYRGIHPGRGLK